MTRKCLAVALLVCLAAPLSAHEGYRGKDREEVRQRITETAIILDGTRPTTAEWTPAEPLNAIDAHSFAKMRADGIAINGLCDDSTFIRRLFLLLTGRLPEGSRTRAFLVDDSPSKRAELIDEVLASEAFVTHWSFWFQEYFESTASELRAGHRLYNEYFEDAVRSGKPLDQMARELITASGLSDEVPATNFLTRARNRARLPQDYWDNAAIAASTKMLGVPLECISCHDGAYHLENINLYLAERKRSDLWGMAAFFSDYRIRAGTRLDNNLVVSANVAPNRNPGYEADTDSGDRPARDGGLIAPTNMFTGEGVREDMTWRESFADQLVTDRQFARNWANRFWGELFGLAMVEPRDGFDLYRIDPDHELPEGWEMQVLDVDLLEHTTDKMIALGYDMRAFLRYVCNSATFQMSPEYLPGGWKESWLPYYARYTAHHMDAETVFDSMMVATGLEVEMTQRYFNDRGNPVRTRFAHGFIDNNQPRGRAYESVVTMLTVFGRGNRLDLPRGNGGSVSQALVLMSSPVIDTAISNRAGHAHGYADAGYSPEQIVEALFLDTFCRAPSEEETAAYLAELERFGTARQQAETAMWLLLNRVEFTYIY